LFADHEATAVSDSAPHPTGIRVAASPPESPFVTTAADAPGPPVQAVTPDLVIEAHQPISLADPPAAPAVPDEARHPGERPPGLLAARSGRADDLKWIKGIGPLNESRLNALGIWHFEQIATWSPDNVRWIGSYLAFHGRIDREHWIDQAKALMAGAPPAPKRSGPKGAAAPRP
jgi:predicted flap endonuclease-1-like 5' DNA nuclease